MITTNTGAKKLESSDNWREIFPNSTLGTAGAHNASVDAADRIQPEIAPIINGKQCALGAAKDDYVLLRNSTITGKSDGAYIAAKAIPANTDIDSTYLGNAITGGISNSINSNITKRPYFYYVEPTFTNGVADVAISDIKTALGISSITHAVCCLESTNYTNGRSNYIVSCGIAGTVLRIISANASQNSTAGVTVLVW